MDDRLKDIDVLALPTTPIVAPTIAEMRRPTCSRAKCLLLRNTSIANFFDLCAISLPLPPPAGYPAD